MHAITNKYGFSSGDDGDPREGWEWPQRRTRKPVFLSLCIQFLSFSLNPALFISLPIHSCGLKVSQTGHEDQLIHRGKIKQVSCHGSRLELKSWVTSFGWSHQVPPKTRICNSSHNGAKITKYAFFFAPPVVHSNELRTRKKKITADMDKCNGTVIQIRIIQRWNSDKIDKFPAESLCPPACPWWIFTSGILHKHINKKAGLKNSLKHLLLLLNLKGNFD